jgi:chemotaxis protein MotB
MTLLLTFFVLLLSMSTLDSERIKVALGSLRGSVGVLSAGGEPNEGRKEIAQTKRVFQGKAELMTSMEQWVQKEVNDNNVSRDFIQIGHKDEAVFISLDDSLLFAPGSTDLMPTAFAFLDDLGVILAQSQATVEFIGHSDESAPIGYYADNWEVAAGRALAVLEYTARAGNLPGHRLKFSSHGEFLPRASNWTTDGRARNRRVELMLTLTSASDRWFYGEDRLIRPEDKSRPGRPAFPPEPRP